MKHYRASDKQTAGRSSFAACVSALLLCSAAACSDVNVLNAPNAASAASPGSIAATQLTIGPYSKKAVVMITADGNSAYIALPMRQSGMTLTIREPGRVLAQDSSFEFHSFRRGFQSAASYNFILPAGQTRIIQARVDPVGAGGAFNRASRVRMTAIALAAR